MVASAMKIAIYTTAILLAVGSTMTFLWTSSGLRSVGSDGFTPPPDPNVPVGMSPYESYFPQAAEAPSSETPDESPDAPYAPFEVITQYVGYGADCDKSQTDNILVNWTQHCEPGCRIQGDQWVLSECNNDFIILPDATTWVEYTNTGFDYDCVLTPHYATYEKANQCNGEQRKLFTCSADTIYEHTCNSSACNECKLSSKRYSNECYYGEKYNCYDLHYPDGKMFPNPLMKP